MLKPKKSTFEESKIAQRGKRGKTPYNPDGTITLWHGSPDWNKESILQHGIVFGQGNDGKPPVEAVLDELQKKLKLTDHQVENVRKGYAMKSAVHRFTEAERRGKVVYLSADYDYSLRNSLASREWFGYLLDHALREKYATYYRARQRIIRMDMEHLELMKRNDQERDVLWKQMDEGKFTLEAMQKRRKEMNREEAQSKRKVEEARKRQQKKYHRIKNEIDNLRRELYGWRSIMFEVRIPVTEVKQLAEKDTLRRMARYEKEWKREAWDLKEEFLREVRVTGIDPKFIVSHHYTEKEPRGMWLGYWWE